MSDPVDIGRLTEAVDAEVDKFGNPMPYASSENYRVVFEAARAVLEAPSVEWCRGHDEPKDMRFGMSGHVVDEMCEWVRVRLVPESEEPE